MSGELSFCSWKGRITLNDLACLPPETLEHEISVTIVDEKTPIQEINTEIFAKLDI